MLQSPLHAPGSVRLLREGCIRSTVHFNHMSHMPRHQTRLAYREAVPGEVITTATADGLKVLIPGKKARFSHFSTYDASSSFSYV